MNNTTSRTTTEEEKKANPIIQTSSISIAIVPHKNKTLLFWLCIK